MQYIIYVCECWTVINYYSVTKKFERTQKWFSISCWEYFQKERHSLSNILACVTDWALLIIDHHHSFISFLKKAVPCEITEHYVIHWQHLAWKVLNGYNRYQSLCTVITAVNKIKANAFNSWLFRQWCTATKEDFECLLLHTEVRSLSKCNSLRWFYALFTPLLNSSMSPILFSVTN